MSLVFGTSGLGSFRKLLRIECSWFGISRKWPWDRLRTFTKKLRLFWKLQEAAVNPLLVFGNLLEVAVKQRAHFSNEILMVWEAPEGCCESSMLHWNLRRLLWSNLPFWKTNIKNFGRVTTLFWIHYWWFRISSRLLWTDLQSFAITNSWFYISRKLLSSHLYNFIRKH